MHTVEESLKLLERQAELEQAAQLNGGFRLREEKELRGLHRQWAKYLEAIRAVLQASHALRRPIDDVGADLLQM
jgi:hypothetical protein